MKKLFLITLVILFVAVLGLQSVAFAQQADFESPTPGETDEALASAQAVPGSISGLKIISTSHNSVKLTWKKAANAYKYQIYRSLTWSGGYKLVRQQRTLTYTDTGLKPSTVYFYKVIPATQSGVKGKTAGPTNNITKDRWVDGTWLQAGGGEYRHMYYFNQSSVSHYRVDTVWGKNYLGRDWGTYPVTKNSDGSFNIKFSDFTARVIYVNDNKIVIKKPGEPDQSFNRLDDSKFYEILNTAY